MRVDEQLTALLDEIVANNDYIQAVTANTNNGHLDLFVEVIPSVRSLVNSDKLHAAHATSATIVRNVEQCLVGYGTGLNINVILTADLDPGSKSSKSIYSERLTDNNGLPLGVGFVLGGKAQLRENRASGTDEKLTSISARADESSAWIDFGHSGEPGLRFLRGMISKISNSDLDSPTTQGGEFVQHAWKQRIDNLNTADDIPLPGPLNLAEEFCRTEEEVETCLGMYALLYESGVIGLSKLDSQAANLKQLTPGVTILSRPQSSHYHFIFGGAALFDVLQMPPLAFLRETGLVNHNIALFRDRSLSRFKLGISRQTNSRRDLLQFQSGIMQSHPDSFRFHAVGTSAGAFAAIVTAYKLRLETAWVFGLPTLEDGELSLPELLATPNGRTRYKLYFNENFANDRKVAEQLGELPGIELHPQPGDHHFVVHTLHELGLLPDIFPHAINDGSEVQAIADAASTANPGAITNIIIQCMQEKIDTGSTPLTPETAFSDFLDSFEMVEFLVLLEEKLGMKIPFHQFESHNIDSISALAKCLEDAAD